MFKNDEDNALKAIDLLPDMKIRSSDIVAHRINWNPKWQNIAEIADDLSLGLANILFIDDNPVEREQVRRHLPEVKVLELPKDPSGYLDAVLECPWLECLTVTAEDSKRVKSYKNRTRSLQSRNQFDDVEEFYASLQPKITFAPLAEDNKVRAVQLVQKTNQFNTTTKRYSQAELEEMVSEGSDVYVLGVEDKFFEFENIGVLIVKWNKLDAGVAVIDSYILSCRVLGRGLEKAILGHIRDLSWKKGAKKLYGELYKTERNTPAQRVFKDSGFVETDRIWSTDLTSEIQTPTWVEIISQGLQ